MDPELTAQDALAARLHGVRQALHGACAAAGRDPATVRLVAVSKLQPAAAVAAALRLGQCDFGENYAQELRDKSAELAADAAVAPDLVALRWHFIGPLQRNKVHLVAGRASLIHSVDSIELVQALAARLARSTAPAVAGEAAAKRTQDCLVQVSLAGELQKAGCEPESLPPLLDAIAATAGTLRCRGLMCLPPQSEDPEASRPYFRRLRELAQKMAESPRPHVEMAELSMGMSHDFQLAVAEGATLVRVGTAIFGPRT